MDFTSEDFDRLYTTEASLGAFWSPAATTFRLWAPEAALVTVRLYQGWEPEFAFQETPCVKGVQGVWEVQLTGDWSGYYYTFVTSYDGRGALESVDPYAKAVGPQGQRGFLFNPQLTNPQGWDEDKSPPLAHVLDSVIYELHVRDASSLLSSGVKSHGTFAGLSEEGTQGPQGIPTALDHVAGLGVTHVHLLPVYDFDGVDDLDRETEEYNWGYNPRNFNALKLAYSTDPRHPQTAVSEFKTLVQTFHRRGLRVVLDVVYNHTFASFDSHLNRAYPYYYYRMIGTQFSDGSGVGNELATERAMVRKYIVDSLLFWQSEYHIDGFRFDLMGLYDLETMNQIEQKLRAVDSSILLYGEGWTGGMTPQPENTRAVKGNAQQVPGVAFFSDESRDTWKGHVFESDGRGFVNGGGGWEAAAQFAVSGCNALPALHRATWAAGPQQVVNYVAAHDNHTLWDKLALTNPQDSEAERKAMAKLAHAAVFLSQGLPFLHAGEEFLRTKQGVENSYNSPDRINGLDWERAFEHHDLISYIRGLLELRRALPELRLRSADEVSAQLHLLELLEPQMIAWWINQRIYAVLNAHPRPREVFLPTGNWHIVVNETAAGTTALGVPQNGIVTVAGRSAMVLVNGPLSP